MGGMAQRPKKKGYRSVASRSVPAKHVMVVSNADAIAEQLKQGLQGIVMGLFTRSLGWTPAEVEVFLVELRKQLDDKSYQLLDHASVFAFSS